MSDKKKTAFADEVGCGRAIWSLMQLAIIGTLNGSLWYMLLAHVEAPPSMWVVFWVWIPSQFCMSGIGSIIDWIHKMAQAKERPCP